MSEAPQFWFQKPGLIAWLLSPVSLIYGRVAASRMEKAALYMPTVPVLCVGNFVAGGAGKTPTAIALAKAARDLGLRPGFMSRGYGGSISAPTLVDDESHNARDVGDEPLVLCQYATTVVSADRPAGARLLEKQDIDLIIMDDGFQNPTLHKDYSLLVVDALRGIGNGFCLPAGPLRAPLVRQLSQAASVLLIGQSEAGTHLVRRAAKMAKPVVTASIKSQQSGKLIGKRVLAFSGIADARKFRASLVDARTELVEHRNFPDHHFYTDDDCSELIARAVEKRLTLVTTQKDSVRLRNMGAAQEQLHQASVVLQIALEFDAKNAERAIIAACQKNAEQRRLLS